MPDVKSIASIIMSNSIVNTEALKHLAKELLVGQSVSLMRRSQLSENLAAFLCSEEKFTEYFLSLPEVKKEIILRLVFSWGLSAHKVLSLFSDTSEQIYKRRSGYSLFFSLPLSFVSRMEGYGYSCISYTLHDDVKLLLSKTLAPFRKAEEHISEEQMKSMKGYFSYEAGLEFFTYAPQIIQVLKDSQFFEREVGAVVLKNTRKKIAALVDITPFFSCEEIETNYFYEEKNYTTFQNARLDLAIAFIAAVFTPEGKTLPEPRYTPSDPKILYRFLVESFFKSGSIVFDTKFLYPGVRPEKYETAHIEEFRKKHFPSFLEAIKKYPPKEPVRFDDFLDRLREREFPLPAPMENVRYTADSISDVYTSFSGDKTSFSYGRNFVSTPSFYREAMFDVAYTNLFLLLASLGLFSITWEPPVKSADFIEQSLEKKYFTLGRIGYIVLTPLGAYTFGLTDALFVSGIKTYTPPLVDDLSPVITIEADNAPMRMFLESFCVRLSPTLFKADSEKILRFCKTKKGVIDLFAQLESYAERTLSSVWKDFEKKLCDRFVTLEVESDWKIFSLKDHSPAFCRCMEKLCYEGLCTRMEGNRVAIKKGNIDTFLLRLFSEGFSVDGFK